MLEPELNQGIELVSKAFFWPQRRKVIKHVSVSLCFINPNSAADDQMATGHVLYLQEKSHGKQFPSISYIRHMHQNLDLFPNLKKKKKSLKTVFMKNTALCARWENVLLFF